MWISHGSGAVSSDAPGAAVVELSIGDDALDPKGITDTTGPWIITATVVPRD